MLQPAVAPVVDAPVTPPAAGPSPSPPWSLPRRVGFRFVFAFVGFWLVPFPIGTLPWTGWLAHPFDRAWDALTIWAGRAFLHRPVDVGPNGSGDTSAGWLQLALCVGLALAATAVWSVVDRRRAEYARLSRWLHAYLRFAVGTIMIGYGLAKVFHSQFPSPSASKLEQPYGDASPMGLLWTFMGFSGPYNVFTGLAEAVPAVLLFFRRTATVGALVLVAVMTNVVLLNFCYDVPVKIYSTELMLASLYIAGPRLRALADVLVLGRAVAATAPSPLFARRRLDLAARVAGVAFCGYVLVSGVVGMRASMRARAAMQQVSTGLSGNWLVDSETRDGKAVAPDDPARWVKLGLFLYKNAVRADYHQQDGFYDRVFFAKHDAARKTLTLDPDPGHAGSTWSYAQPDADHLTIDAVLDGHRRALALHRDTHKREWRLLTRGFHWVNESPYNR